MSIPVSLVKFSLAVFFIKNVDICNLLLLFLLRAVFRWVTLYCLVKSRDYKDDNQSDTLSFNLGDSVEKVGVNR